MSKEAAADLPFRVVVQVVVMGAGSAMLASRGSLDDDDADDNNNIIWRESEVEK
jgi:hypothetical protein